MKNQKKSGYDYIATFYDDWVGLFFGKAMFDAQTHYFSKIPDHSKVLILGGGSGWILPILLRGKPHVHIVYIDSSAKMIELAKSKVGSNQVDFICGTEEAIPTDGYFDFLVTNFYLDGFSIQDLPLRLEYIRSFLQPQGRWIVTDFVETANPKDQLILRLMHFFFRILIRHPNTTLVNWQQVLSDSTLVEIERQEFKNGFIKSILFQNV